MGGRVRRWGVSWGRSGAWRCWLRCEAEKRRAEDMRRQKINQLDHEISLLNGEINLLTKDLPTLPDPMFALGSILGGAIAIGLGMLVDGSFALGGFVVVIIGIGAMVNRNKFYREKYKPLYDNIEKHKQRLRQLIREQQYLKNA